jgi:nitrile hydratase
MPHDHHEHLSPSGHPYRADNDLELSYWQTMEIAVRELLVEKQIVTASEINSQIDVMDARNPTNGAKVVARYWTDPEFATALLADGSAATREMGFDIGPMKLIALPNAANLHNIVVCTLCSCYPRNLLGFPPE